MQYNVKKNLIMMWLYCVAKQYETTQPANDRYNCQDRANVYLSMNEWMGICMDIWIDRMVNSLALRDVIVILKV